MTLTKHHLAGDTPTASFEIAVYEFGRQTKGPKIYLQAGMHADEHPGMLILHHLITRLKEAEKAGTLAAHFVILPMVNPLGMAHLSFHMHRGRYHPENGLNYNRGWPDFSSWLTDQPEFVSALGDKAEENKLLVRRWLSQWLSLMPRTTALDKQRHFVMSHCYDADMVLDLHCDDMALNHIFIVPQNLPRYQGLADRLGSVATLTAEDSGGGSFDEVWSGLWVALAKTFPDHAWPEPVLSATLEYRGQADVSDALAVQDARNLFDFFCDEGLITTAPSCPVSPSAPPTQLSACEIIRVQQSGLIAYHAALGDVVKSGDHIADLVRLDGPAPLQERVPVYAGTDGVIFSMLQSKYVWPGTSIAKIAGKQPLASRTGYLLED
ncbi:MAG: succinylglutamate desuccinylase/aspartoacylase family protein [Candidatus Puniceispirillaceae bacterium]